MFTFLTMGPFHLLLIGGMAIQGYLALLFASLFAKQRQRTEYLFFFLLNVVWLAECYTIHLRFTKPGWDVAHAAVFWGIVFQLATILLMVFFIRSYLGVRIGAFQSGNLLLAVGVLLAHFGTLLGFPFYDQWHVFLRELPNGESVIQYTSELSVWYVCFYVSIFTTLLWCIFHAVAEFRKGKRQRSVLVMVSLSGFIPVTIWGIAQSYGWVPAFPIVGFGLMGLIIAMGLQMNIEVSRIGKMQQDLEDQQAHIGRIADAIPGVIIQLAVDLSGNTVIRYVSRSSVELLGLELRPGESLDHLLRPFPDEERQRFEWELRQFLVSGRSQFSFSGRMDVNAASPKLVQIHCTRSETAEAILLTGLAWDRSQF